MPPRTLGNGRIMNIVTVPKNVEFYEFLMDWAKDIGKQVKEGKTSWSSTLFLEASKIGQV